MLGLAYDAFLKQLGLRDPADRGEWKKLGRFVAYQYLLFALLSWTAWPRVLLGTLFAVIVRNYVFVALQTGSSVGEGISTWHAAPSARLRSRGEWYRFQVETSKNYPLPELGTVLCGRLQSAHRAPPVAQPASPPAPGALGPGARALRRAWGALCRVPVGVGELRGQLPVPVAALVAEGTRGTCGHRGANVANRRC